MKPRLVSLDAFRGATIAAMVLVNNPGSETTYAQLEHAAWNGWTFTDTIFPSFLWIAGVSMTLSFARRVEGGANRTHLFLHALRRSVLIFLVGVLLNAVPPFHISDWRIPGVLQRIAVCYLIAAAIFLFSGVRGQVAWLVFFLVFYAAIMRGDYSQATNFARSIDNQLLAGHMWAHTKVWDPEGIVSTLPAISTALFGVLTGHLLPAAMPTSKKIVILSLLGVALIALGLIGNVWIPINKNLWTSSYAVFMAGISTLAFTIFYWLIDVRNYVRWASPFVIFGMNALAVYTFADAVADLLDFVTRGRTSLGVLVFTNVFAPLAQPINASLLFAIAFVLVCYAFAALLYWRRWFVKL